jgi:putative FmdB family regulatory protein
MPLYEYQCEVCGHRFEVIQKFSDPPPSTCPKCGGAVEKLVSSPAIQFKGSGFYLTDYGRGGKSDTAPSKDGKASAGEKAERADKADKGDKGEKADKADRADKAEKTGKSDAAPSSSSSGESGGAKSGDSKPAAPPAAKSD